MPCLFFSDLPLVFQHGNKNFNPKVIAQLFNKIAALAGVSEDEIEIHVSFETRQILNVNGKLSAIPNVHCVVQWYGTENRDETVKGKIAQAIQHFANMHQFGHGLDITFMDMPAGSFYREEKGTSVLVPGGIVLPPYEVIAIVAHEETGWENPNQDSDEEYR